MVPAEMDSEARHLWQQLTIWLGSTADYLNAMSESNQSVDPCIQDVSKVTAALANLLGVECNNA